MQYAGFGLRFVAYIIDNVILYIVTILASALVGGVLGFFVGFAGGTTESAEPLFELVGGGLAIVISWLYYALQESSPKQATLGKQAMSIVVTDLSGQRISFGTASGRFFGKILSGLILAIGYLMIAFTEKKQGLHDILAGCLVVKK